MKNVFGSARNSYTTLRASLQRLHFGQLVVCTVVILLGAMHAKALTGVSLTADKVSPQLLNTTIRLTATPTPSDANAEYRFREGYQDPDGTWHWRDLTNPVYQTTPFCDWTPSVARRYRMVVWARDVNDTNLYDAYAVFDMSIGPIVTLLATPVSPSGACPVTLSVTQTGGVNLEYRFREGYQENGTWYWRELSSTQYQQESICSWIPPKARAYRMVVWVRSTGSPHSYDSYAIRDYTVTNARPNAVDDMYTIVEDGTLSVPGTGLPTLLANDGDPDGQQISAPILINGPSNGSLSTGLGANGSFIYTPTANWNGTDRFTYKVSDGALDSNIATVTIVVTEVSDAPVAVADPATGHEVQYTTISNMALSVAAADGVLINDSDVDTPSSNLQAIQVTGSGKGPVHGSVVLNPDGTFTYTPAMNWHGTDSFTYKAFDGTLYSNEATVSVVVNAPPSVSLTTTPTEVNLVDYCSISLSAEANDIDGTVTKVEFFDGDTKIGEDLTAPYEYILEGVRSGGHYFSAVATDNQMASTTSMGIYKEVKPAVSVVDIQDGSIFPSDSSLTIEIQLSESVAPFISSVEYFANGNSLGEVFVAPYSFIWNNVSEGSYELTAVAKVASEQQLQLPSVSRRANDNLSSIESVSLVQSLPSGTVFPTNPLRLLFTPDYVKIISPKEPLVAYEGESQAFVVSVHKDINVQSIMIHKSQDPPGTGGLNTYSSLPPIETDGTRHFTTYEQIFSEGDECYKAIVTDCTGNVYESPMFFVQTKSSALVITQPQGNFCALYEAGDLVVVRGNMINSTDAFDITVYKDNVIVAIYTNTKFEDFEWEWQTLVFDAEEPHTISIHVSIHGREIASSSVLIYLFSSMPNIRLVEPGNTLITTIPSVSLRLSADAWDSQGIEKVEFTALKEGETTPINISTAVLAPYIVNSWTPPSPGIYTITATATDYAGQTNTDSCIVQMVAPQPIVEICEFPNNQLTSPASATFSVRTFGFDGPVTNVQLLYSYQLADQTWSEWADIAQIAPFERSGNSAFVKSWSGDNIIDGSYRLKAVATDSHGTYVSSWYPTFNVCSPIGAGIWIAQAGGSGTVSEQYTKQPFDVIIDTNGHSDIQYVTVHAVREGDGTSWSQNLYVYPYKTTWTPEAEDEGTWNVTATAHFIGGGSITTETASCVNITRRAPTVYIIEPASAPVVDPNHGVVAKIESIAPASIRYLINAYDPNGTVEDVNVKINGVDHDVVPCGNGLWELELSDIGPGEYLVEAFATDDEEATGQAIVPVVLTVTSSVPYIRLTAPGDGWCYPIDISNYKFTYRMTASVVDPYEKIKRVEFYAKNPSHSDNSFHLVDSDSSAPYECLWSDVSLINDPMYVKAVAVYSKPDGQDGEVTSEIATLVFPRGSSRRPVDDTEWSAILSNLIKLDQNMGAAIMVRTCIPNAYCFPEPLTLYHRSIFESTRDHFYMNASTEDDAHTTWTNPFDQGSWIIEFGPGMESKINTLTHELIHVGLGKLGNLEYAYRYWGDFDAKNATSFMERATNEILGILGL